MFNACSSALRPLLHRIGVHAANALLIQPCSRKTGRGIAFVQSNRPNNQLKILHPPTIEYFHRMSVGTEGSSSCMWISTESTARSSSCSYICTAAEPRPAACMMLRSLPTV